MKLELAAEDGHHIRAAEGWLDRSSSRSDQGIGNVAPQHRAHPAVLILRCRIYLAVHKPGHTHGIAATLTVQLRKCRRIGSTGLVLVPE